MRHISFLILLAITAGPALAQSVEQDLAAGKPLEIALWGADLSIDLRPGATPHLKAYAVTVKEGSADAVPAAGPTVGLREQDAVLRIVRTAESEAVRLRLEVTLDVGQPVTIIGKDLDVAVVGPAVDFRKMAEQRRKAVERGEEPIEPTWTDVSLQVEDSRADLSGVSGGALQGRNTWFVVRQSANQLTVKLEGGAAELKGHRGWLVFEGRGGEIKLADAVGKVSFQMAGASLVIASGEGRLEGQARGGATVRLDDWAGQVDVESFNSLLELQNFRPDSQMLKVLAEDSEVTVEAMDSGHLELDQKGGRLRVRDVHGKMKITASGEADVELERLAGPWKGIFDHSTIVADGVERFDVELTGAELRLQGAEDLLLTAIGSEIVASEVRKISQALLVDTSAELELTAGSRAQIEAEGESRVFVGMPTPCFVLAPPPRKGEGETPKSGPLLGLDVAGCTLGGNVGRGDQEGESVSPSFLSVTLDEEAQLNVRGR